MTILTIDPGTTFGWSLWKGGDLDRVGSFSPFQTEQKKATIAETKHWLLDTDQAIDEFKALLHEFQPKLVVCEFSEFFASGKGQATAKSGALVKLTFIIGRMAQACANLDILFLPAPVSKWRGQIKDPVVKQRCIARLGELTCSNSHEWDAVGIGLWALTGRL